ncbi:MAG: hypothetical protein K2X62_11615 [Beijerinckiaceae bacterium]|jgi:hypothetical protein|nr:hypothetical protein [Beijerinckiaceae bacterium]MDO9441600.1 hypothetical protein [Beijerinckiaceae bacterium]
MNALQRVAPNPSGKPGSGAILALTAGISLFGLAITIATHSSPAGDSAAAIFPPWWSGAKAFEAAATSGQITRLGAFPFVVVVRSDDPGLASRLRDAGAVLVLDPVQLALCDTPRPRI